MEYGPFFTCMLGSFLDGQLEVTRLSTSFVSLVWANLRYTGRIAAQNDLLRLDAVVVLPSRTFYTILEFCTDFFGPAFHIQPVLAL